jgi:hypothetical protein
LLKELQLLQASELKALDHRHKFELKELKASQSVRRKEWETSETEKRKKFIRQGHKGVEIRAYMKDLFERRKTLMSIFDDELAQRAREQDVRRKAIKDDQDSKLKEFKEFLGHGQRPPERLWPAPGR